MARLQHSAVLSGAHRGSAPVSLDPDPGGARERVRAIIDAALVAVDPDAAVRDHLSVVEGVVHAGAARLALADIGRVVVVGAGKAGVPMARAVESVLGADRLSGHVVVPHGQASELAAVRIHEAGHPVPDRHGVEAGREVMGALESVDERTLVICLISGGGSALLVCPAEGIGLDDLRATNEALLACGATIVEINTLRKHLSALKGGQLARAAAPAAVVTLVLSDVVGDPLDAIASGPTVPDTTSFADCLAIVDRYRLEERLPDAVLGRLRRGAAGEVAETPKPGDAPFERVTNVLVANNARAVEAAAERAEQAGYRPLVLSTTVQGETREVAKVHAAIAAEVLASGRPCEAPCCLISGGETTVTLRGDGRGGRNQEFVLAAALEIAGFEGVTVCSIGTDGIDGSTDAAGAMADGDTAARAVAAGIDPSASLANNDSHAVFVALDDLVITGPTDTNVMDLRLVLIE